MSEHWEEEVRICPECGRNMYEVGQTEDDDIHWECEGCGYADTE